MSEKLANRLQEILSRFGIPILILGIIVNIGATLGFRTGVPFGFHRSGELSAVLAGSQETASDRYRMFAIIGELSPGAVVLDSADLGLDPLVFDGLGDVTLVEETGSFNLVKSPVDHWIEGRLDTDRLNDQPFLLTKEIKDSRHIRVVFHEGVIVVAPQNWFIEVNP